MSLLRGARRDETHPPSSKTVIEESISEVSYRYYTRINKGISRTERNDRANSSDDSGKQAHIPLEWRRSVSLRPCSSRRGRNITSLHQRQENRPIDLPGPLPPNVPF